MAVEDEWSSVRGAACGFEQGDLCFALFTGDFPPLFFGRDRMMLLKLEQEILEFISDSK